MKNTSIMLLICCTFMAACDQSTESERKAAPGPGTPAPVAEDTASALPDAAAKAGAEIDNAVKSAKAIADDLAVSAQESAAVASEAVEAASQAAVEKTSELVAAATSDSARQGESVYKSSCFACHGTGAAGAPKLDDKAAWKSRIAQGSAVLARHAIEGYQGNTGFMPPRGGAGHLSDEEVTSAVEYMVSQIQ